MPRNRAGKPAGDVPELVALGEELAARRRSMGLLQQDVAEISGVSRSTVYAIEHGAGGVRWEKINLVAHAVGLRFVFRPEES